MESGGMRRQRSRRRISRNKLDDPELERASAAAASLNYEEGEPVNNLPHLQQHGDGVKADPRSSWYNDVLNQGGSEELNAILQASEGDVHNSSDADEVLEQYRIMAHVEASIRVKDNTGFDMAEYEKRRKLHPEPTKLDYFDGSRKPKAILPDQKVLSGGSGGGAGMMKPDEPPLPVPRPNRRYLEQKGPLVPDLCDGVAVKGAGIPDGHVATRCLGCKTQLRTNMFATLVKCPECSTVSPATSTRR
jgi:hypothetical protein